MPSAIQIEMIELLLRRLERVPADSIWAHRASGLRGSLLKRLESLEAGKPVEEAELRRLTEAAFKVLRQAAEETSPTRAIGRASPH